MKRLLNLGITIVAVALSLSLSPLKAYAKAQDYIRVGLESSYKQVQSLKIDNTAVYISLSRGGSIVNHGELYSNYGFSLTVDNLYYAETDYTYESFNKASEQAALIAGFSGNALCAYKDSLWTVYMGGYQSEQEALSAVNSGLARKVVYPSGSGVRLEDGDGPIALFTKENGYALLSTDNTVLLGNKEYRGYIEAGRYTGGVITAVNVIDVEDYLRSVVPSEMPSSWPIEALKAQTVAARSYTYTRMGIHSDSGYDLCDGIHCQVYNGYKNETESTNRAVDETAGLVALYQGEVINATFFSSSGGATDNSENVWANKLGYLRAVADPYDTTGKIWSRTFTLNEIDELLRVNNMNIGNAKTVAITEVSPLGRVQKLTITGSLGSKTLEKEDVRNFFSKASGGALESRYFTIGDMPIQTGYSSSLHIIGKDLNSNLLKNEIYVIDSKGDTSKASSDLYIEGINGKEKFTEGAYASSNTTASTGTSFTINGRGWGHGVGLSQHGAKGMAESGFTFEEILKHFYTDIEIR